MEVGFNSISFLICKGNTCYIFGNIYKSHFSALWAPQTKLQWPQRGISNKINKKVICRTLFFVTYMLEQPPASVLMSWC